MPYKLKGNCVIKSDTGETVKCHGNHADALAHLQALEANVPDAGGKSVTSTLADAMLEAAIKAGARHNTDDRAAIQKIHDHACGLGAKCDAANTDLESPAEDAGEGGEAGGKSLDDDTLVYVGGAVKALGNGEIGGYLVKYSDWQHPDLSEHRDYFDAKTYYGAHAGNGVDTTINHTMLLRRPKDAAERKALQKAADQLLPPITATQDELGIFAKTVTDLSNEYHRMVYGMAERGELSWSSGAISHMVKRSPMPNGTNHVDRWVIGEAALTPTPADPFNGKVLPIKSLNFAEPGQAVSDETTANDADLIAQAQSIIMFAEVLE